MRRDPVSAPQSLPAPKNHHEPPAYGATRILILVGGIFALALAVIGALLPVMPTTPFLLLGAYCFARSSERCHTWLTCNRFFGRYVAGLVSGRGLSSWMKAAVVACSVATAMLSAVFLAPNTTVRIVSLCMAAGMSAYILLQGRRRRAPAHKHALPARVGPPAQIAPALFPRR